MKWLSVASVVCLAASSTGCKTTPTSPDSDDVKEASTIQYTLPDTRAKIDVTFTLESCDKDELRARAKVSITPYAAPSAPTDDLSFELRGSELESFWKKRDVKIELHPHGALKSINAGSKDATAGIIGGFIKLAAAVAGADDTLEPSACNSAATAALAQYNSTKTRIEALRRSMASAGDAAEVAKHVAALTEELARLETGELQVKLSTRVDFSKGGQYDKNGKLAGIATGGIIQWQRSAFNKWFTLPDARPDPITNEMGVPDGKIESFSMAYCVRPTTASGNNSCTKTEAIAFAELKEVPIGQIKCVDDDGRCTKTIVLRDPVPARLVVVALGSNFSKRGKDVPESTALGGADFSLAQWGELSYLDLSVGFGGERSVALALDGYGRKTQFGWTSNARGEGIVTGLNTINEAYSSAKKSIDGEDLQEMKARVDELETRQKLNKLENCEAILDNGGFVCPSE